MATDTKIVTGATVAPTAKEAARAKRVAEGFKVPTGDSLAHFLGTAKVASATCSRVVIHNKEAIAKLLASPTFKGYKAETISDTRWDIETLVIRPECKRFSLTLSAKGMPRFGKSFDLTDAGYKQAETFVNRLDVHTTSGNDDKEKDGNAKYRTSAEVAGNMLPLGRGTWSGHQVGTAVTERAGTVEIDL